MYHVSAQGVDERMINVHYYYYRRQADDACLWPISLFIDNIRLKRQNRKLAKKYHVEDENYASRLKEKLFCVRWTAEWKIAALIVTKDLKTV